MSDVREHLDDIEAHVDEVACSRTVVTCSRVTLECIRQITAVQVMIAEVIVATSANQQTNFTNNRHIRKTSDLTVVIFFTMLQACSG